MAQQWQINTPHPANNYATDLNNMRAMFETLRTTFSGSSAPANPVEGMLWRDTNKAVWKARAASAWRGLMHGDVNQKIYVYRNNALEGWIIDTAVADCVLAFKGGNYGGSGGALAGSWTLPNHTHGHGLSIGNHSHLWYTLDSDSNATGRLRVSGNIHANRVQLFHNASGNTEVVSAELNKNYYTGLGGASAVSGSINAGGAVSTVRPRAAVGTLQRLDL